MSYNWYNVSIPRRFYKERFKLKWRRIALIHCRLQCLNAICSCKIPLFETLRSSVSLHCAWALFIFFSGGGYRRTWSSEEPNIPLLGRENIDSGQTPPEQIIALTGDPQCRHPTLAASRNLTTHRHDWLPAFQGFPSPLCARAIIHGNLQESPWYKRVFKPSENSSLITAHLRAEY